MNPYPQAELHTTSQGTFELRELQRPPSKLHQLRPHGSPRLTSPFPTLGRAMFPQSMPRKSCEGTGWLPPRREIREEENRLGEAEGMCGRNCDICQECHCILGNPQHRKWSWLWGTSVSCGTTLMLSLQHQSPCLFTPASLRHPTR